MQVAWTLAAARDLEYIGEYLKEHQPTLAEPTVRNLYNAAESLVQFPDRGRIGRESGTRELVMSPLPYVIVYVVGEKGVSIARVLHAAQHWPPE